MEITHNEAAQRFEKANANAAPGLLEYRLHGDKLDLNHTEVPPQFEGQGIGTALVKYALEYARDNNLQVIPSCPFVEQFINQHPEYQDLVA